MQRQISIPRIVIALLVLAFLFWHPITRSVVWVLLPIGFKPDDLVVWAILFAGVALVLLTAFGYIRRNAIFNFLIGLFTTEKRKNDDL